MNTTSPKSSFSLYTVICTTFGHDYIITRKVTDHINEYKCTHCGREVTNNYNGKVELLTQKVKQVNTNLVTFIQKKRNRITVKNYPHKKHYMRKLVCKIKGHKLMSVENNAVPLMNLSVPIVKNN